MAGAIRDALLDEAQAELAALEHPESDEQHRQRLEVLVDQLERGVPSPLVLEAVTTLVRRRR